MASTKDKILKAWKSSFSNLGQKKRFKKEIGAKAEKEGEKIFMKLNKKKADKNGNFPKAGEGQSKEYNSESGKVSKQTRKMRVKDAKKKGII